MSMRRVASGLDMTNLPDGTYSGKWSGYEVTLDVIQGMIIQVNNEIQGSVPATIVIDQGHITVVWEP